jgi:hypothetical protein
MEYVILHTQQSNQPAVLLYFQLFKSRATVFSVCRRENFPFSLCVIGWCGWPHAGWVSKQLLLTRRPDIPPNRNLFFLLYASNLDFSVKKERKRGRWRFLTGAKETGVTPRISDSVRDAHGCGLEYITSSQHDPLSLSLYLYCACVSERRLAARRSPDVGGVASSSSLYTFWALVYILAKKCAWKRPRSRRVGWFKMRKRPPYSYRLSTAAYNPPPV